MANSTNAGQRTMTEQPEATETPGRPMVGLAGFALGGLALLVVMVHLLVGPFSPRPDAAVTLGEMASQVGKSALRDIFGLKQPGPKSQPWDIDRILKLVVVVCSVLGVILGAIALFLRERRLVGLWAIGLGIGAITIQILAWTVLVIAGVLIIISIMSIFDIGF